MTTVLTAVAAAALVAIHAPPLARLVVWPLATAAAVTWLQVVHRFCVAFGALGLENFGRIGEERGVDSVQRAADRRRAAQLIVEGSIVGAVVTLALALLPI